MLTRFAPRATVTGLHNWMCWATNRGMDLWYLVSKLFWALAAPSTFLCVVLFGAVAARLLARRWGRRSEQVGVVGALALALAALTPLSDALITPLEQRFPARDAAAEAASGQKIAGIILLGGGLGAALTPHGYEPDLNEAADRIRTAAAWAKAFPEASVIVSGGPVSPQAGAPREADLMADALMEYGIAPARIRREAASRTTAENAAFVHVGGGAFVLVTSAFHMPRSVGALRARGVQVVPAPCDWRVDRSQTWMDFNASENLKRLDIAVKEYIGLVAYRLAGKNAALFPGPDPVLNR